MKGHVEVVRILLEDGANVDAVKSTGSSSLHWAAWIGNIEMVKVRPLTLTNN